MLDLHSHILPKIDDGSKSEEETLQLLNLLTSQKITRLVATPHYLPSHEPIQEFLDRRQKSFERVTARLLPSMPQIHLGAEISYYEGVSKLKDISTLKISGSDLLLIEMPVGKWSDYVVHEIMDLACLPETKLVLAHIERYRQFQSDAIWYQLLENDILMQVNAGYFTDFVTKRKALKQLKNNEIHFLGSDCHNLTVRPPKIGAAYELISRKMGNDFLNLFLTFGHSFFEPTDSLSADYK